MIFTASFINQTSIDYDLNSYDVLDIAIMSDDIEDFYDELEELINER